MCEALVSDINLLYISLRPTKRTCQISLAFFFGILSSYHSPFVPLDAWGVEILSSFCDPYFPATRTCIRLVYFLSCAFFYYPPSIFSSSPFSSLSPRLVSPLVKMTGIPGTLTVQTKLPQLISASVWSIHVVVAKPGVYVPGLDITIGVGKSAVLKATE